MSVENCQFSAGCLEMSAAYHNAAKNLQDQLDLLSPASPADLEANKSANLIELENSTAKFAEVFHGQFTDAMFGRLAKVGGVKSDCLDCPIRQICFDVVRRSPPIDPNTGELFA